MTTSLAMIAEDNTHLANIMELVLQKAQFETEIASDGQQALDYLAKAVPDLVVLDLHMPRVSGKAVLAHLRNNQQFSQTKVILATSDSLLAQQLQTQVDGILIKPFSIRKLNDLASRLRS